MKKLFCLCAVLTLLPACTAAEVAPVLLTSAAQTSTPIVLQSSATASPTPSPTLTPSPTPTPTPMPDEALAAARLAYHNGDWETAETLYRWLLESAALAPAQSAETTLDLGQTYLAQGDFDSAIALLSPASFPEDSGDTAARAKLILADAQMALGDVEAAAETYRFVAEALPELGHYAYEWSGDAYYQSSQVDKALAAYQTALGIVERPAARLTLLEKLGLTYAAAGDYENAMASYDTLVASTELASLCARIMYQAAETALLFEGVDEYHTRLQSLIAAYPAEPYAYEALLKLVDAEQPVDDWLRGYIDYHAEAYSPAVQAFYRVVNNDAEHSGAPHYYAGLSFLEADSPALAVTEFETLLTTHPGDPYWGSAWIGLAQAQAALGKTTQAIASYRSLAEELPDHPRAPEALWDVAELLERSDQPDEAARAYIALAEAYPDDEGAPEARFQAGLLYYRMERWQDAVDAWSELILWYPSGGQTQGAWYWMGMANLNSGRPISATQALSTTVETDVWSFYGLQAADQLAGRNPFPSSTTAPVACGSPAEQGDLLAWLETWVTSASGQDIGDMPAAIRDDPRLQRGRLLLELGHFDAGRAELESLRQATVDDPAAQYHLALYFRDIGLYRSSIIAANTLWRMSPAQSFDQIPRFLACLIYPLYYSDLVEQEAAANGLDPLFVYALLRQESLFEGFATSYAAAHGLMQVIPPTGQQIAAALGWPEDYNTSDLYRPMVSVHFGVWYLAQQRDWFEGELYPAMAAYNGGPGNAASWWESAGENRDLFVELIGFSETQTYVRRIREQYARYLWLYRDQALP